MPANPFPNGEEKDGYTRTTRAVGSSGTAATIWAGASQKRTDAISDVGKPSAGTSNKFERIVNRVIHFAVPDNGKRCCSGPMIAAISEVCFG
jgi:hypothetical protein